MKGKSTRPRFTVIIPLESHRGQAQACLRRWAREQTYPRDRYEILAAGCRDSLDQPARSLIQNELQPNGRLVLFDEAHDMALNAHAATEARGQVIIFTESHCLPEPNVLTIADQVLQAHPEWAGFSGSTTRILSNRLSVAEADMYEADIRYGMEQHPWLKLLDQCFVVRADYYRDAGGFRPELGHFAEWQLAANLHGRGHQLGYVPEVRVWHYYAGDLNELIEFTADFARGEMTFHSKFSDDQCASLFEPPTEWLNRHQWSPRLARRARALAWQARSTLLLGPVRFNAIIAACRVFVEWNLRAYLGPGPEVLWASLRFRAALLALRLGLLLRMRRQPLLAAFLRMIDATVRLERIRFVARWLKSTGASGAAPAESAPATSVTWRPDLEAAFRSLGIHALEDSNGQQFRWSEPVGMLEVSLLPGRYNFHLEWLPLKPVGNVSVYLNEKPLSVTRTASAGSGILDAASPAPMRFAWTCEAWMPPADPRLLGLPLTAISINPLVWGRDSGE